MRRPFFYIMPEILLCQSTSCLVHIFHRFLLKIRVGIEIRRWYHGDDSLNSNNLNQATLIREIEKLDSKHLVFNQGKEETQN